MTDHGMPFEILQETFEESGQKLGATVSAAMSASTARLCPKRYLKGNDSYEREYLGRSIGQRAKTSLI